MRRTQLILLGAILLLGACQAKHEYYEKVNQELASGEHYDSLFLNINFGMTEKEFYAHCWEMNKTGVFTHGNNNMSVQYEINKGLKAAATMNFYPEFHEDKIYKMPAVFSYKGWAPWNEHLGADSLLLDVVNLYKDWYADEFMKIESEARGTAYVMIHGNRRISIYKKNVSDVEVMYTDLLTEEKLTKNQ